MTSARRGASRRGRAPSRSRMIGRQGPSAAGPTAGELMPAFAVCPQSPEAGRQPGRATLQRGDATLQTLNATSQMPDVTVREDGSRRHRGIHLTNSVRRCCLSSACSPGGWCKKRSYTIGVPITDARSFTTIRRGPTMRNVPGRDISRPERPRFSRCRWPVSATKRRLSSRRGRRPRTAAVLSTPAFYSAPLLRIDPGFAQLRDHPRFQALLARYENK